MYLTEPGLIVHVFLSAGGEDSQYCWDRLRPLWSRITGGLGRDPAARLAPPNRSEPLAAAGSTESVAWQASGWADHGVVGITVKIVPRQGGDFAGTWASLEHTWATAADLGHRDIIGETRIFLAILDRPSGTRSLGDNTERQVIGLVRAAVPEQSNAGWWQHTDAIQLSSPGGEADDLLIWEVGSVSGDVPIARRLIAVAPVQSGQQAEGLLGTGADDSLAPVTRHLVLAARLRQQIQALDGGRRSRQLCDELDTLIDLLSDEPADEADLPARVRAAHEAAVALRAQLDTTRQVIGVIVDGMRVALNPPVPDAGLGPLSRDRSQAVSSGRRLDDECVRLDAAIRNAQALRRWVAAERKSTPTGALRASATTFYSRSRAGSAEPRVVVFTALGIEYQAVREYLADSVRQQEERGTLYEVGKMPGVRGGWDIVLVQTGPGSTTAAVQLDRAVRVFAPHVALFLGVAGGRKDVNRGDVVVADLIYDYEWGKSTLEGFEPRIRIHHPSHRLLQRALLVARENRWQKRILPNRPERPPAAFVKPIVTGSKVIAHHESASALMIDQYAGDSLAVEMEGHGFLEAAHVNQEVDALVIRGISDLLTGKTEADDEYWQPLASRHAAAFAVELLDNIGSNWRQ